MQHLLAVACGGAIGAAMRYGVGLALHGTHFAYATLLVNLVGCFVLGALIDDGLVSSERFALLAHPGITVGLLGGLTTFSTFGFQTVHYLENGYPRLALLNVTTNVLLGLAAVWAGMALSRLFAAAQG